MSPRSAAFGSDRGRPSIASVCGLTLPRARNAKATRTTRRRVRRRPRRRHPQGAGQQPLHGEGYRKIWARLRLAGLRTAKRRVLRLCRENGLLAPHRQGPARGPRAHDGTITTKRIDEMWGTDLTATATVRDGQVAVFIAVDHCSAECVGIHAAKRADRFEALEPVRQGVRENFGGFEAGVVKGLKLRHDHGSQYMADDFQERDRMAWDGKLAVIRARPEGNGCAERFIRTLKENLLWVQIFATVEELRQALLDFKRRYNTEWLISDTASSRRPPSSRTAHAMGVGCISATGCLKTVARVPDQHRRDQPRRQDR